MDGGTPYSAYGGSSYGYKTGIPAFSLGGSQRLVARGTNELLTNQYFLGQLGYIRELVKVPPLLGSNVEFIGLRGWEDLQTPPRSKPTEPPDGWRGWDYREHNLRAGRTRRCSR